MARSGLLKSDVKKARDSLLAQQINPSVDAVRVALGNTGSKTTIHKYLKELDDDTTNPSPTISESLLDLVERLAAQLQAETDSQVDEIRSRFNEKDLEHVAAISEQQNAIAALSSQVLQLESDLSRERNSAAAVQELLQQEMLARHAADQQVVHLKERLAENESHRQSIEEKHLHAREALEHYRQSVKEQRDQDQRRHEQQIQQVQAEMRQLQQSLVIKQDEVTRLNQEGVRLITDLSHAQKSVYEQQTYGRQLEQKLEALPVIQQQHYVLVIKLEEKDMQLKELTTQISDAINRAAELSKDIHRLELELASANATIAVQEATNEHFRAHLERQ
ncbi:DNA-binding protein [Herminiimonas arsenitoxidans]|uniref:DNA-binding protein n=1 Tax=Herminiimonas arsenitoxidans TaxID=1809410 RepID=UPI000971446B|nr:DNA-binding protein [Herminiimonas arsenitoxidans]